MVLLPVSTTPAAVGLNEPSLTSDGTPISSASTVMLPPACTCAPASNSAVKVGVTVTCAFERPTLMPPAPDTPCAKASPSTAPVARTVTLPPTSTLAPPPTLAADCGVTLTTGAEPLAANSSPPDEALPVDAARPLPVASTVRLAPEMVALPTVARLWLLALALVSTEPTAAAP